MTQKEKDQKLQLIFAKGLEFLDRVNRPPDIPPNSYVVPEISKEILIRGAEGIISYSRIMSQAIALFAEEGTVTVVFSDRNEIYLRGTLARAFMEKIGDDLAGPLGKRVEVIDADKL